MTAHVAPNTVFTSAVQQTPGVLDTLEDVLGKLAEKKKKEREQEKLEKNLISVGYDPRAAKTVSQMPEGLQKLLFQDEGADQILRPEGYTAPRYQGEPNQMAGALAPFGGEQQGDSPEAIASREVQNEGPPVGQSPVSQKWGIPDDADIPEQHRPPVRGNKRSRDAQLKERAAEDKISRETGAKYAKTMTDMGRGLHKQKKGYDAMMLANESGDLGSWRNKLAEFAGEKGRFLFSTMANLFNTGSKETYIGVLNSMESKRAAGNVFSEQQVVKSLPSVASTENGRKAQLRTLKLGLDVDELYYDIAQEEIAKGGYRNLEQRVNARAAPGIKKLTDKWLVDMEEFKEVEKNSGPKGRYNRRKGKSMNMSSLKKEYKSPEEAYLSQTEAEKNKWR